MSIPSPPANKIDGSSRKREILQIIASIFDPLGYFAPTILEVKLFMKKLWIDKCDWDGKLDERYEAVVNCRLLVYVDDDINSNLILTPSHFLSLHSHIIPDIIDEDDPEYDIGKKQTTAQQLLETWRQGQKHLNQFWSCWKNDYLLNLRKRGTKRSFNFEASHPAVRDVVLIKDNLPRGQWRVGKISELIKGRDKG